MPTPSTPLSQEESSWSLHEEGQLAVDVAETGTDIIIRAAIAGVHEQDLDIHITDDIVSIHGKRTLEALPKHTTMHYSECFWGSFSRTIILPCHVKPDESEATLVNGILTIRAPKTQERVKITINKQP